EASVGICFQLVVAGIRAGRADPVASRGMAGSETRDDIFGGSFPGGANQIRASRADAEIAEKSLAHRAPIAVQSSAPAASPREPVVLSLQCVAAGSGAR